MTNQVTNPYAVLGVPRTASASQLRAAYRRLAKQFHPDRDPDAGATEQMQRINQAWQMLATPTARARYEAQSAAPAAAAYPHWGGAPRTSYPRHVTQPGWAPPRAAYTSEAMDDDRPSLLRWVLLLLLLPVVILLAALLGGFLPFPFLGLFVFLIARTVLGSRD